MPLAVAQSVLPQMVLLHQKVRNGVTEKMGNIKRKERVDRFVHELATPFALKNPHRSEIRFLNTI